MAIFEFFIALVAITGVFAVVIVKTLAGRKAADQLGGDETQLMQELHQGLSRMEKRVENLETLMMRDRGERPESREERLEREFRNLEK